MAAAMVRNPLSLYVHIPFCSLKCSYCDFNSYANLEHLVPEFTRALTAEMRLWSPAVAGRPVPTVFFGGGTPTLLPLEHMQSIVEALRRSFDLPSDAEITTEASPGTLNLAYLRGLVVEVDRARVGLGRDLGVRRHDRGQPGHDQPR